MKQLRRSTAIVVALLSTTTLAACGAPKAGLTGGNDPATVTFYSSTDTTGATKHVVDSCNTSLGGGVTIDYRPLTIDAGDVREQLTRKLSARDTTLDVLAIPIEWAPEFAASGWSEELRGSTKSSITKDTLAGPMRTVTYKKHLYGAPWTTDTQVVLWRTDLLDSPPATWDEMTKTATNLEKKTGTPLIEIEGAQGNGLADLFVSLTNSYGAALLNKDADTATVGDATQHAATNLRDLAKSSAFDASTFRTAGAARETFLRGSGALLIDSANALAATTIPLPIAKDVASGPWPRGIATQDAHAPLGGTNLVISAYSKHQKQALKALDCLRSAENQTIMAKVGSQLPTLGSLYTTGDSITRFPATDLRTQLDQGTSPLQTPVAEAVNTAMQTALVPLEAIDPTAVNDKLEKAINGAVDLRAKN